ncbi:cytochrome C oxidase Cbb3 [Pelomonas sp. HMWF004]|nr:cytochrome C oxidase Cbb3 [Pelomonas sp. HMWF004]
MSDPHISPQQERENPDPHERTKPVPWPLIGLVAVLFGFGIVYISGSDIDTPAAWGDERQAAELAGAKKAAGAKVDGAALYASLCAACHQASGQGLPGVFPPLAASEWVLGKDTTAAAILLHGINGPLTVKGTVYNGAMPAFGGQLSDEQIAAVLSHIRSQWGNTAAAVTAETVAAAREEHKGRTSAFAGDKDLPPHD